MKQPGHLGAQKFLVGVLFRSKMLGMMEETGGRGSLVSASKGFLKGRFRLMRGPFDPGEPFFENLPALQGWQSRPKQFQEVVGGADQLPLGLDLPESAQ